jgi:hypothetical protein
MASYKVIQDIEAEDKLIGPLTFRQFVYAGAAVVCYYLTFLAVTKNAGFLAVFFLPVGFTATFFAYPWGRDQPTEIWALAKIRFMIKPRRRIWDQSGVKELVTITAPKKIETNFTNGLSQTEVRSRLRALADTIDSRGWAIKNVSVNMYGQPALVMNEPDSDRLIDMSNIPQQVPTTDIQASDDILDEQNNPIARQFDNMIAASTKAHRQQIIEQLHQPAAIAPPVPSPKPQPASQTAVQQSSDQPASNNYWFLHQPSQPSLSSPQNAVTFNAQVVAPGSSVASLPTVPADPTPDEEALVRQLGQQNSGAVNAYSHLHTILPLSAQAQMQVPAQPQQNTTQPQVTQSSDAAILDLARNDDLNVATIAREAHKRTEPPQDEVVISLH